MPTVPTQALVHVVPDPHAPLVSHVSTCVSLMHFVAPGLQPASSPPSGPVPVPASFVASTVASFLPPEPDPLHFAAPSPLDRPLSPAWGPPTLTMVPQLATAIRPTERPRRHAHDAPTRLEGQLMITEPRLTGS